MIVRATLLLGAALSACASTATTSWEAPPASGEDTPYGRTLEATRRGAANDIPCRADGVTLLTTLAGRGDYAIVVEGCGQRLTYFCGGLVAENCVLVARMATTR